MPGTAIFGGSFDPIHNAHLALACAARDAHQLDRVLFVPAAQPPHKPQQPRTPGEHPVRLRHDLRQHGFGDRNLLPPEKLSDKLIGQITKKWVSDTSGSNRIRMKVSGVKNHKMLSKFIKVLKNQVRSVKDVNEQRFKHGTAVLDVMLAGDTRAMATELEAKDFGGAFKIEIDEVTGNSIAVKLLP